MKIITVRWTASKIDDKTTNPNSIREASEVENLPMRRQNVTNERSLFVVKSPRVKCKALHQWHNRTESQQYQGALRFFAWQIRIVLHTHFFVQFESVFSLKMKIKMKYFHFGWKIVAMKNEWKQILAKRKIWFIICY